MIVHNTDEALIYQGDCLDVLRTFPANVVDTVITDPPYGLEFMGKGWDKGVPGPAYWAEALRVIKPGGTLLAFGGTRTYHRLACAIEDAGWEIVDCLMFLYGSGFPKSMDISKAIDKAAGAEREVLGEGRYSARRPNPIRTGSTFSDDACVWGQGDPITAPATPAAQLWNGYGTALKPAWEPIIMARAPREGTYAANALAWGVAGLNADGARIQHQSAEDRASATPQGRITRHKFAPGGAWVKGTEEANRPDTSKGRWPANLILDEAAGALLDEQSGVKPSRWGKAPSWDLPKIKGSTGGASRFFKCCNFSPGELILCRAKAIMRSWNPNLANIAVNSSSLQSEPVVSALNDAVTLASHGARRLNDYQAPSTPATVSALNEIFESVIAMTLSSEPSASQGLEETKQTLTLNPVSNVETPGRIATTTTTTSPRRSAGSVVVVTSSTMPGNTGAGAKDSRFKYCAKASKAERNAGLDARTPEIVNDGRETSIDNPYQRGDTLRRNTHPTVKPLALMRYLAKLTKTPTGGVVLDPFAGSGSTLIGAVLEGRRAIGIELEEEYAKICAARVDHHKNT